MHFSPYRLLAAVAALALLVVVGLRAAESPSSASESDGLLIDAASYAAATGLPLQAATQRLEAQAAAGPVAQELEAILPGRLAGVWLEDDASLRLVAYYTGDDAGLDEVFVIASRSAVPVEVRTGAALSLEELRALSKAVSSSLRDAAIHGVDIDIKASRVVVLSPWRAAADVHSRLAELPNDGFGRVTVEISDGSAGDDATYGGKWIGGCTTAFTVAGGGTTGVLTAAHCSNTNPYYETPTLTFATQFKAKAHDASRDVQWKTVDGPEFAQFFDGLSLRPVNGQVNQTAQVVGSYLCKYGRTTGYSCGQLLSKSFTPGWLGACPVQGGCHPTWHRVASPAACSGGDSGGPYFVGNFAYGVHKGHVSSTCAYMAIDYVWPLSVTLLTQ
jgi:hypothetical protein